MYYILIDRNNYPFKENKDNGFHKSEPQQIKRTDKRALTN